MSRSPRILFVSNFLSGAGLNRGYSEELADRLEAGGSSVIRTSSQLGRGMRLVDMLRTTWAERHHYTVAHVDVFSGPSFLWAEIVCFELRRLGKPYVLTLRGGNLPEFARACPRRTRRLFESAALVTVPSSYLEDRMRAYRRDLKIVPNAIDAQACGFVSRPQLRPRLVWMRAFHAIYNPVLAVDVLARLRRRHRGASLKMVGPDKDGSLADVKRRAHEVGIADSLTVIPGVAKRDVARHLADADLFINTTNIDNTPVSVLDAMACGLCVVSTNVGGIAYLLEHDQDALLVPPNDPEAMTDAVHRILTEPGLALRLSRNARRKAETHDWSVILPHWESMLLAVAGASRV